MTQYIITIVPVVEDGFAGPVAQTMVRIETEGNQLTVKELTLRAPEGAGLVSGELPKVDFELLLRAFAMTPRAERTTAPGATERQLVAKGTSSRTSVAGSKGMATGRSKARKVNPRASKAAHLKASRAYRRAPEAAALEQIYGEVGTIAGVAAHFGVPVHTAQGWISRLRRNVALTED